MSGISYRRSLYRGSTVLRLSTFLISPDSLDCLYQLLLAHSGHSNIISMFTIKVIQNGYDVHYNKKVVLYFTSYVLILLLYR